MLVMLSNKHTKNACLLCDYFNHLASRDSAQDTLVRTPLLSTIMKAFPSGNGLCDPKLEDGNAFRQLAPCLQGLICPPTSNGHFTPLLERSYYPADEGWQWQEEI
ncbi:hypothetical protein O181_040398 [Austropuccinia psidii MF-1]|uniref:Uncharacterized protein n=1 Tax=Austropuccinia psidii MF-1 TaxID=1389203 RepID=A0A9Q3DH47_9BASI|nr:hypothetical protein [Austropuccinia psidii MF-1]